MKIKQWIFDKISDEAANYNTFIDVTDKSRSKETRMITADEKGFIEVIVEETIRETEKAVNVKLSSGSIVGSSKGWTCWIPKSQIA